MEYDCDDKFFSSLESNGLSILSQIEFNSLPNRKENCHHDYIAFNLKGIVSLFSEA